MWQIIVCFFVRLFAAGCYFRVTREIGLYMPRTWQLYDYNICLNITAELLLLFSLMLSKQWKYRAMRSSHLSYGLSLYACL